MHIIAVEGIDCSGKETQVRMLADALYGAGLKVCKASFPRYDKPIGSLIRQWLDGEVNMTPEAAHMLYEADRQDFMEEIKRLEHSGCDILLIDRFTMSNLAFGVARGVSFDWLRNLQGLIRKPDLTFILDISAETSFKRKSQRDRNEQDATLLDRARSVYRTLAKRLYEEEDDLIVVVDANHLTPDEMCEVLLSHIEGMFLQRDIVTPE